MIAMDGAAREHDLYAITGRGRAQPIRAVTTPVDNTSAANNFASGDFIVGPENRLTASAILSLLSQEPAWFSPLVLHGPSGIGKSHLAQCVAQSRADAVYIRGADFVHELAAAIDLDTLAEFRAKYRTAGLLIFDDLLRLTGRRAALQELQHLLDLFEAREAPVLIVSPQPPADVAELPPSLRSRLSGGLVLAVSSPGRAARQIILQHWAASRGIALPAAAAQLLAKRIVGPTAQLRSVLMDLHVESLSNNDGAATTIDLESVHRYLSRRRASSQPTLQRVSTAVARHYGVPPRVLSSPSRRRHVVLARAVAIYLGRSLCGASLKSLGQHFGGRDHTTALHSFQQIEQRLTHDLTLSHTVQTLQQVLTAGH